MRLRPVLIVNPASDQGRTGRIWDEIKTALKLRFREFITKFTEAPGHATEIVREELKKGQELLIGVGGDGTLNELVNGYFEEGVPINPEAALSIIPSGRGNDFIKSLSLPSRWVKALKKLGFHRRVRVDVGRFSTDRFTAYFLNVLDIGLGGEIVREMVEKGSQHHGLQYTIGLLKKFFVYRSKNYRIVVDGKEIKGKFLLVAVANGKVFGGGMKIAPVAEVDDGMLEVVAVEDISGLRFLANLWRLYAGKLLSYPKVRHWRARRVEIYSTHQAMEYDGELAETSSLKVEVLPSRVVMAL